MLPKRSRIEGGLIGLLVGDALGVPYEFHDPSDIPPLDQIEFVPPASFHRSHPSVAPGTWSDDGAQALCLLASLLEVGHLDPGDFGRKLLQWRDQGYMAVNGKVFDIGITTSAALQALKAGVPPLNAGLRGHYDNGNGSLMRVLPLALWHTGPDEDLVQLAHQQSCVTHGHMRSQVCCAYYCLWARYTLLDHAQPWVEAAKTLRDIYKDDKPATEELENAIRPEEPPQGEGTGYVVDCLRSAYWATQQGNYEQVVRSAVSLGNDTDTTACVAGGIAGLRDGIEGIPSRWRNALLGKDLVEPLMAQLLSIF